MIKAIHRVNTIKELKKIPKKYGVEVDVRSSNNNLILSHEPFNDGDLLEDYLSAYNHALLILEIKEEGIEGRVIELCRKFNIKNYFLLSVSFPFIYFLSKKGFRKMAARFSEFEEIDTCLSLKNKIEWIWVDTFTKLPIDKNKFEKLKNANFKICMVSPERWNRPDDIKKYFNYFKKNRILLDAVMTEMKYANEWQHE